MFVLMEEVLKMVLNGQKGTHRIPIPPVELEKTVNI